MSILIAYTENKERISIYEYTNQQVFCNEGHCLVAKKGQKNQWHFAHRRKEEEDSCPCSREKGEWHCWHQGRIKKENIEIPFSSRKHIADCVNKDGLVIEFQKSTIPKSTIQERELFYKNMIWVFCMDYHDFEIVNKYKNILHLKILKGSKYFLDATTIVYLDSSHKKTMMKLEGKKKSDILVSLLDLNDFDEQYLKDILVKDADKRITGLQEEYECASNKELLDIKKKWKFV